MNQELMTLDFLQDIIPYVAERIFQLEPEPPAVDSLNEYILSALQEKKFSCREQMLQKLMDYDPAKDAVSEFAKKYNCDLS